MYIMKRLSGVKVKVFDFERMLMEGVVNTPGSYVIEFYIGAQKMRLDVRKMFVGHGEGWKVLWKKEVRGLS